MPNQTFLYSGQMGGKSTFVGGLYSHVRKQDNITAKYKIRVGSDIFQDRVLSLMMEQHQYPTQNPEPYIVDFSLERESGFQPSTKITVIDPPGEVLESDRVEPLWKEQQDEGIIEKEYQELDINKKVRDSALSPADWNVILTREYLQSDNIIFILNLHKILMTDQREPTFSVDDLLEVTKEKNVAVVATGTDILDHKPDEDVVSSGIMDYIWRSGSPIDSELLDEINDATPPHMTNLLNTVKMEGNMSFFGVAVPSRKPGEDDSLIATEDGGIETWGFENVVRWLS